MTTSRATVAAHRYARPATLVARAGILAAVLAGVVYNLYGLPLFHRRFGDYYRIDLDVYRIGGAAFARGAQIYGKLPLTEIGKPLPFTYPPLAAIAFSPMSWMPLAAAGIVMTVVSIVGLFATIVLTLRSLGWLRTSQLWTAAGVLAVAFVLEPVFSTLNYGQINILLMALVAADCLLERTPWPRGALIGLVAALKLTPAVFVLFFLLRKDFRAAIVTAISFAGCTLVGFALAAGDSVKYWTSVLPDSNRIGKPAYAANQSIIGVLARLGIDNMRTPLWILAAAGVFIIAVVAMRRAFAAGEVSVALGVNALAGLLVSPVSWSHHWVWVVPLLLSLTVLAYRRRNAVLGAWILLGLVVFHYAPHWRLAHGRWNGIGWPLPDQLLAASYVWWGLGTLALLAVSASLSSRAYPESGRPTSPSSARTCS
nr:glycosyltransferase 87 family protein [Skermania sp. ID1734]